MTDLTDKWKKGKLPEGFYYFKLPNGEIMVGTDDCLAEYLLATHSDRCEVLREVPTFEEWQASENYIDYLKQCISVYESKDKQATETSIAYNELLDENTKLKEQVNHLLKTQARQFVDNQKLQVKAKKAKDVVNIDTARQIKQLKELLKECELWFTGIVGNMNDKNVGEHNRNLPIGNFEHAFKVFSQKIKQALGEDK